MPLEFVVQPVHVGIEHATGRRASKTRISRIGRSCRWWSPRWRIAGRMAWVCRRRTYSPLPYRGCARSCLVRRLPVDASDPDNHRSQGSHAGLRTSEVELGTTMPFAIPTANPAARRSQTGTKPSGRPFTRGPEFQEPSGGASVADPAWDRAIRTVLGEGEKKRSPVRRPGRPCGSRHSNCGIAGCPRCDRGSGTGSANSRSTILRPCP